jgi:quinol monooxygenase YgiN
MEKAAPRALLAEVTALPGNAELIRDLLRDYGQKVRQEPGNRVFSCHQVEARPNHFVVYEVYDNEAAFQAHLAAPYGAELNQSLKPLIEEPQSVLTFLTPPY